MAADRTQAINPNPSFDTILVDGGVVGCWIAYRLAQARRTVLLLEQRDSCFGAYGRNGGWRAKARRSIRMRAIRSMPWPRRTRGCWAEMMALTADGVPLIGQVDASPGLEPKQEVVLAKRGKSPWTCEGAPAAAV